MEPFDDEDVPLFTVGQVAEMLSLKQAFLRRIDELQVVSPQRSAGRQRRYTRVEIRVIRQVATMADEGMTLPAIRRIIELEQRLAEVARQRDDLAARLSEVSAERMRLARQLAAFLQRGGEDGAGTAPAPALGPLAAEHGAQVVEDGQVVDGRRDRLVLAVGEAAHRLPQDLPRAGLGQAWNDVEPAQRRDGADAVTDHLGEFRRKLPAVPRRRPP